METLNVLLILVLSALVFSAKYRFYFFNMYKKLFLIGVVFVIINTVFICLVAEVSSVLISTTILLINIIMIALVNIFFAKTNQKNIHKTHFITYKEQLESYNTKLVNLQYLRSMGNDSDEFICNTINDFMENIPHAVNSIKIHLANSEWKEAEDISHRIKPVFNTFGMNREAKILHAIELNIQGKSNYSELYNLIQRIDEIVSAACKELIAVKKSLK
jgi:energy-coupling factor transporter transmembrane protein EcfT